jgi:hypothetical protein
MHHFPELASSTLSSVTGGAGGQVFENVRDGSGAIVNSPSAVHDATRSVQERVNTSVDRQMAPWNTFNGLFGGAAVGAPGNGGIRAPVPAPSGMR